MQTETNTSEQLSLDIKFSRAAVTRRLVYVVTFIHTLNAFAVWFRYEADPFPFKSLFVKVFQVSSEGKFPTWYSTCTLFICSILLLVISYGKRRAHDRYVVHWFGLAVIFALMSLDEATALHEMMHPVVRRLLNITGRPFFGWEVVGLVFLMLFCLFYFRFLFALDRRARCLFLASGFTYVFGVIGMELVGRAYSHSIGGADLIYGIIASVEEIFEMAGIVIFIYALLDYLETHYKALSISFEP